MTRGGGDLYTKSILYSSGRREHERKQATTPPARIHSLSQSLHLRQSLVTVYTTMIYFKLWERRPSLHYIERVVNYSMSMLHYVAAVTSAVMKTNTFPSLSRLGTVTSYTFTMGRVHTHLSKQNPRLFQGLPMPQKQFFKALKMLKPFLKKPNLLLLCRLINADH